MTDPLKTAEPGQTGTTPSDLKVGRVQDPTKIVGLVHFETGTLWPMPLTTRRFTVSSRSPGPDEPPGPPGSNIVIASKYVSSPHCTLTRTSLGLQVACAGSKNGTYFHGEKVKKPFYLRPGNLFAVAAISHRLIALNGQMFSSYPRLIDILGEQHEHATPSVTVTPSGFLVIAAGRRHVLITSGEHCEQHVLAQLIHELVPFEGRPSVECRTVPVDPAAQSEIVHRAVRSTLILNIGDDDTRIPSRFLDAVFSSRNQIRVVMLARGMSVADRALGQTYIGQMQHMWVPELSSRPEMIHRLLDGMFEERGSALRVANMTAQNQAVLQGHSWPEDFASLRQAADLLVAIHKNGTKNAAAQALGMSPSSMYDWWKSMRFSKHLLASEESAGPDNGGVGAG